MVLAPGLGVFGVVISYWIVPLIPIRYINNIAPLISNCLYLLTLYITPYATLMFGLTYSGWLLKNSLRYTAMHLLLMLPISLMLVLFHFQGASRFWLLVLCLWSLPYIAIANSLLFSAYLKERIKRLKQKKLITCILFIPATLVIETVNIFNLPYRDIWRFNTVAIITTSFLFLFVSIRYGILGAKLKLEREQLAGTIRSVTSGTMILSHTIKNEINKMSVCMVNIKSSAQPPNPNLAGINENIQFVYDSLEYLSLMVKQIQNQMEEILITKKPINPAVQADKTIELLAPLIRKKNIKIVNLINPGTQIFADGLHLQEVFNCIVKNSIEALKPNGTINLEILEEKKSNTIIIRDNGFGISKDNLSHVLEPFFTTKSRQKNFGLGLTYCYSVMQKHDGNLEIESEENIGTTVLLTFPIPKIQMNPFRKRSANE
jgi:signal transduction histidine kinase